MKAKRVGVIGVPGGWSSELLADAVARRTGSRHLFDLETVALDLELGIVSDANGLLLNDFDALIVKKAGTWYSPHLLDRLEILRFLSERGVRVFSDPLRILRVLDRMSCTVALRLGHIPMPPTAITENVDKAVHYVQLYEKAIFKPLYSTKARGMEVIESGPDARTRIEAFHKDNAVMYIQKLVDHPGRDMGVAFLGGKYLATYARTGSKDSWNTTTRSGGKYQPCQPVDEILALADRAQRIFGLDFTCVDVVETPDGPKVFEVSAFGGFRGLLEANGIDAASLYVDYVRDQLAAS